MLKANCNDNNNNNNNNNDKMQQDLLHISAVEKYGDVVRRDFVGKSRWALGMIDRCIFCNDSLQLFDFSILSLGQIDS